MGYYDKDRTDNPRRVMKHPGPGLGSVAEYQMSGRPYVIEVAPDDGHANGDGVSVESFGGNTSCKGDDVTITFPFVTKRVTIKNLTANNLFVYFCSLMVPAEDLEGDDKAGDAAGEGDRTVLDPAPTARGDVLTTTELDAYNDVADARPDSAVLANSHYYTLGDGETIDMNVRCRRIYIAGSTGSARVYAELTGIVHPYNLDLRGIDGVSGGTAGSVTE